MIKLQSFRLVNVHANNNTIIYPDVTFNLNEENTLIDAKNGGGKTLAVQMLFQTLLPNSSFDGNKTIKTLFENVPVKTTMHSVSCFKLSNNHDYDNLCLGFAVSKSQDVFNSLNIFNYVIEGFNLEENNLSVETLNLNSNGKVISIADLKKLFAEKNQHKNSTFKITTFDNAIEDYMQYLKKFDINSQVFKFLMNINQTENYIQQYFEKNCSTQQGLLTDFIIPNTISALDEKKNISSLKDTSEDDISILAQSLLEKSKSLNELRTFEVQLDEYQKIVNLIDTFMIAFKNNRQSFVKYQKFLGEYSKQYSNFHNEMLSLKDKLDKVSTDIEEKQTQSDALDEKIEYLITRKIELDIIDTQDKLSKAEKSYTQCKKNVLELQSKLNSMLAINSMVEYKQIESFLNVISQPKTLDKNISKYANTIQKISSMQLKKTEYEMQYVKDKVSELNDEYSKYMQTIGRLKTLSTACEDNIRDWSESLNNQLIDIENIQNKISSFKMYGSSLLESEELFSVVDNIKDIKSKLDILKDNKLKLQASISLKENSVSMLEKCVQDCNSLVEKNSNAKLSYENEVVSLKNELGVEEFEFENKYNDLKARQSQISLDIIRLTDEIKLCKDNISTMKKYGMLREKSRYDALELLQSELETACFGSEVLQGIGNIKLLEKLPSLAEVVIVSDKDYQNIKNGKKKIPEEVLKENFVIMPYDTIRNINKLTFSEMLFLTHDANYYKSMMDTKLKIEKFNQQILSNKYQIEKLNSEYDNIQILCNKILTHVSMYSFDVVQELTNTLNENTSKLNQYTTSLESIKTSLSKEKTQLEDCSAEISTLEEELSNAESKKVLLDDLIRLIGESHRNQISITNENKKLSSYNVDIKDTQLKLVSIQSKISSLQSDYEYQKSSILTYQGYIAEVKGYLNDNATTLDEKNLELLVQQFRNLKSGSKFESIETLKPALLELLSSIKSRDVFTHVDFKQLHNSSDNIVPFDTSIIEKCKLDIKRAKKLLKEQSAFMISQNNALEIYMSRFDERLNAEDTHYDIYRNYSVNDVEVDLDKTYSNKDIISERLKTLNSQKVELESLYNQDLVQSELYKFFCLEKNLELNQPCDNSKKIMFSDMTTKYNQLSSEYKSALNEINSSIKKLSSGVDSLNISEQIKYTIKNNAIVKRNHFEVQTFADKLKSLKSQAEAMIQNLKTTVENIDRIDEDISEQLYRILVEILDEVIAIPKISKCKFGDAYKETFKINLYEGGKGCRFSEERIKNSIRKYVVELAKDISVKSYDKSTVRELLSIDKIIRFGVDMNKLNIQILKIDQEKPIYQNWENVVASTGQEYIMYVMFTVTMIKYFNNVMGNGNTSPLFVFLDNPFASASDVQLWQPVRKFLDKNDAQLLCLAHNVPSVGQILFERQIILEQSRNDEGNQLITSIRNQKTELKENTQLSLFDHLEIV